MDTDLFAAALSMLLVMAGAWLWFLLRERRERRKRLLTRAEGKYGQEEKRKEASAAARTRDARSRSRSTGASPAHPCSDQKEAGASIIRADFERSGRFRMIDAPAGLDEGSQPPLPELRSRGADALVAGSATRLADGRYELRYKLWDAVKGGDLGGQGVAVVANDPSQDVASSR